MGPTNEPVSVKAQTKRDIASRWTPALAGAGWTPLVDAFLDYYGVLGISNPEAMFLVHLMRHKWDVEMPFPGFNGLADKMKVTDTSVRKYARDLEHRGLIRRVVRPGRTTAFDLTPLFKALEREVQRSQEQEDAMAENRKRRHTSRRLNAAISSG